MANFTIDGKEYDLKLTYESVKRLNKEFEGGSFELIGKAISGDFEALPIIIHAGLLHTGEKITQKKVDEQIEKLFDNEELTLESIQKLSNEVISESFFYKPTVEKLMKQNPDMKKAYEQLMS